MQAIKIITRSFFITALLVQGTVYQTQAQKKPAMADTTVKRISGTLIDAATKKPLAGVNVSIPFFSAAISDEKGNFRIKVPTYDVTLQVSAEGYQVKQVPLKGNKSVSVTLYDEAIHSYFDNANLATGVKPKSELAAPVVSIDPQGAWTRNQETADSYLQGVAGITATRKSGQPGIGASLFMRGMSSLYATNKPLVVVDGMIYDNSDFGGSLISGHYNNPLSLIDMQDIDNITIIKDGSSTYGTKGANGVILITTIKARVLATKMDVGFYTGVNEAPAALPVMNADQYRVYLSDMLQSKGLTTAQVQQQPYMTDDKTSPQYARYHYNTDWQKAVFRNSLTQNAYLRITGGDNIAKYALSMGGAKSDGVLKTTSFLRYNMRFNADLNLTNRLTANSSLSVSYAEQKLQNQGLAPRTSPIYTALVKAPFMGQYEVNDKGLISPNVADVDTLGMTNPAALISNLTAGSKTYRFFGSLQFNYILNRQFTVSTLFGLTNDKVRENFFVPRRGVIHDTLQAAIALNRSGSQVKRLFSVYSDTWLKFKKIYKRIHVVEAQTGVRFQQMNNEQDYALDYNSATDELVNIGFGSAALRTVSGDLGKSRWLNTYANVNYGYDNKLFLNAGVAIDGSSRFGKEVPGALKINSNTYAALPYFGAAWLVSSENFMKNVPALSFLKLRATYSWSGNDNIGDFAARQYYVSQNLLGMQGLVRGNIANPALQWEVNKKLSLGADLGFLNDRLQLSIDVYRNVTDKMLILETVQAAAGFEYVPVNSGAMQTKGIEVNLNARIVNTPVLKWDVGGSFAAYRNKITRLPNGEIVTPYAGGSILTEVGSAANLFYGYKTAGVYSTDAAATAEGKNTMLKNGTLAPFAGGDIRFIDKTGDKSINDDDRQVIGNPNPDFTGTFNTSLTWKRFTLTALLTFSQGNDIYNYVRSKMEAGADYSNQFPSELNRWRAQGQVTNVPKATWGDPMGNARFSDRWIEDGSYLRLRTVSVSYNIKIKPGFFRYVMVYANANNLFTITKYLGYDPEFSATESVIGQGVDIGLVPQFRSGQLGIRVGL
jgi:TonB-linked SusC/RagA family outer membrane protein